MNIHTHHNCKICSNNFSIHYEKDYQQHYHLAGYCSLNCLRQAKFYISELKGISKLTFTIEQLDYIKNTLENCGQEYLLFLIDDLINKELK